MSQTMFSRRMLVSTLWMRIVRVRCSYRIGSALTKNSHMRGSWRKGGQIDPRGHLRGDVVGLADRQRDDGERRVLRAAGGELAGRRR